MTTAIDFGKPVASDNYLTLLATLRAMLGASASIMDVTEYTISNAPTGLKRINTTTGAIQTFDGTSWSDVGLKSKFDEDGNAIKTTYAKLSGASFTGDVFFSNGKRINDYAGLDGAAFNGGVFSKTSALGSYNIDLSLGNCFTKTIYSNITFTISNASGCSCFTLVLTNGGSYSVTWPSTVKWAGGSAPLLTAVGVDVLTFISPNGGETWYGVASALEAS